MALVPLKFIHTITSRKSAELVIGIVYVAATIGLGAHLRHLPRWESIRTATLGFAVVGAPAPWDAPGGGWPGGRWLASSRRIASRHFSLTFCQTLTQTSNRSCRAE